MKTYTLTRNGKVVVDGVNLQQAKQIVRNFESPDDVFAIENEDGYVFVWVGGTVATFVSSSSYTPAHCD